MEHSSIGGVIALRLHKAKRFLVKVINSRFARGGAWLGFGGSSEYFFRLIRNMVLARLLAPEVFGVMAIVLAFHSFFESFTNIGIREAVIQNNKGNTYDFQNSAFWVSLVRGFVLYIIGYMVIPFIAQFYDKNALIPMMRVAFLSILFLSAINPKAYAYIKEMKYKKWVCIYNGGS